MHASYTFLLLSSSSSYKALSIISRAHSFASFYFLVIPASFETYTSPKHGTVQCVEHHPPRSVLTSSLASLNDEFKVPPLLERGDLMASSCCPKSSSMVFVSIW